jgi:lysophospholipase L1-like esterase
MRSANEGPFLLSDDGNRYQGIKNPDGSEFELSGVMVASSALPTLSTDYAAAELDDKTIAKTLATSAALIVADEFSTQTNTVSTYTDESQIDSQFGFGVNFETGRGILEAPTADQAALLSRDGFAVGCSVGKKLLDVNTLITSSIWIATYGSGSNSGLFYKKTNGRLAVELPQTTTQFISPAIAIDDKPASVDVAVVCGGFKTYSWSANGTALTVSETGHTRKVGDYVALSGSRINVASGVAFVTGRYKIDSIVEGVSWTAGRYVGGSTSPTTATCIRGGTLAVSGDAAVAVTGTGTLQLADVFLYVDDLEVVATQRHDNPASETERNSDLQKFVFGGLDTGTTWQGGGDNRSRMNGVFLLNKGNVRNSVASALNSVGFLGTSFYANAGPAEYLCDVTNNYYWWCGHGFSAVVTLAYAVVSNVCTVTDTAHTKLAGSHVYIDTTTGTLPPGNYQITSTATNSWTFAVTTADTSGNAKVATRGAIPTSALDDDSARGDTGVICQTFRTLAKNGYYPSNNANSSKTVGNNRAQSGGALTDAIKQADFWGATPDLVFINVGTNEAASYASYPVAQFEIDYKKLLLKLARQGVKYAVLQTCLDLSASSSYNSTAIADYVVQINVVINGLSAWAAINTPSLKVGVDDCYTPFGGRSPNLALFRVNNFHPNCAGSSKLGISAGLKAVELLS